MLTQDEVNWAYRYILGREPESQAVLDSHRTVPSREALRSALLQSPEFMTQARTAPLPDVWVMAQVMAGRRMMWVNLSDRYVSFGCMLDNYEPFESKLFARLIRDGDTVLDVGANIGWYSMIASTLVGPVGRIIAFEPRPSTSAYLQKTMAFNRLDSIATVKEAAVGEAPGEAVLTWVIGTENPGGSHLSNGRIGAESEGVTVPIVTLDSLGLTRCNVIKIDVEGAELRAMQGAQALLKQHQPLILSELHPGQLKNVSGGSAADYIGLMAGLGYQCFIADSLLPGVAIVDFPADLGREITNVLFVPQARAAEVEFLFAGI